MPPDDHSSFTLDLAVSAAYAAWATTVPSAWPPDARQRALRAIVDTVACIVPGAFAEPTLKLRAASAGWGMGNVTVAGETAGRPVPLAALINGTAAHALDFDDNFDPAKAHISAVLVPALLALAEDRNVSGAKIIDAYIVGLQIAARVGQALNPFHRNRGWHATATVGAVGAAAACARLIDLETDAFRHALNMSTSFAGGFMSQFGSMTKPLHAGKAAEAGVVCALLAEAGMTAGAETFDGPHGMARLMVGPDLDDLRASGFKREHGQTLRFDASIGAPLAILAHGLKVKRFPSCGSTHRALDAVIALKEKHGFTADDVARVDVHAPASHLANLMYTDPDDAMQAKFSMEYCVAVALRTGGVGLADFATAAVNDPATRALLPRVHRHPVDKPESEFPTQVEITLKSGALYTASVDAPKGRADNPMSDSELWDKLYQCCRGVLTEAATAALTAALKQFDSPAPATQMTQHLRFTRNI